VADALLTAACPRTGCVAPADGTAAPGSPTKGGATPAPEAEPETLEDLEAHEQALEDRINEMKVQRHKLFRLMKQVIQDDDERQLRRSQEAAAAAAAAAVAAPVTAGVAVGAAGFAVAGTGFPGARAHDSAAHVYLQSGSGHGPLYYQQFHRSQYVESGVVRRRMLRVRLLKWSVWIVSLAPAAATRPAGPAADPTAPTRRR